METTPRSEKCGFRWQDAKRNHWCEKTGSHAEHECWACGSTPPAATAPIVCPECRDGKHRNCIGEALAADDTLVPCGCPNHRDGSER